jgi:hypothetical protein
VTFAKWFERVSAFEGSGRLRESTKLPHAHDVTLDENAICLRTTGNACAQARAEHRVVSGVPASPKAE